MASESIQHMVPRVLDSAGDAKNLKGEGGYQIVRSGWKPYATGSQRVSIGAASARSAALTVGIEYHLCAKVDCWVAAGTVAVDAVVGTSYFLPAGVILPYVCETGSTYLAVIRDAADSTNGLSISAARV
jgi:hypothetical protein